MVCHPGGLVALECFTSQVISFGGENVSDPGRSFARNISAFGAPVFGRQDQKSVSKSEQEQQGGSSQSCSAGMRQRRLRLTRVSLSRYASFVGLSEREGQSKRSGKTEGRAWQGELGRPALRRSLEQGLKVSQRAQVSQRQSWILLFHSIVLPAS